MMTPAAMARATVGTCSAKSIRSRNPLTTSPPSRAVAPRTPTPPTVSTKKPPSTRMSRGGRPGMAPTTLA